MNASFGIKWSCSLWVVGQSTRVSAALCKFDSTDCMYFYLYSQSKFIGFGWIQMMCHFCSTGRDQKVVENFLSALDCPPNRFFSRCMWVTKYPQLHHCRRDPLFYLNIIQKMKGEWYNQEGASPLLTSHSSLSSSFSFEKKTSLSRATRDDKVPFQFRPQIVPERELIQNPPTHFNAVSRVWRGSGLQIFHGNWFRDCNRAARPIHWSCHTLEGKFSRDSSNCVPPPSK